MNLDTLTGQATEFSSSGAWILPLTALVASFVFGQVLAWTYERTYRGLSYSRGFSHTRGPRPLRCLVDDPLQNRSQDSA